MANPKVFAEKEKELKKKMRRLKIFEKDIKEQFVRSSGPGGQNVNKVSTCVVLKHVPTGVQVKCQSERSQGMNRHKARYLLVQEIEKQRRQEELEIQEKAHKKRQQKRKRAKPLKEKILEEKHKKSEKKNMRKKIRPHKIDPDI